MLNEYSPVIPFEKLFSGSVAPGFHLNINGHVPYGCNNFDVSLICGQSRPGYPDPNKALYVSFRINERAIVRNTYNLNAGTGWGPEERGGGFPLSQNAPFQLDIYAEDHSFKIHINGNLFAEYRYRLALNTVRGLSINGSVNVYQINATSPGGGIRVGVGIGQKSIGASIGFGQNVGIGASLNFNLFNKSKQQASRGRGNFGHKQPPPPYSPFPSPQPGLPLFVNSPSIPTTIQIPGNMQAGMQFSFSGMAIHGGQRFNVNWNTINSDVAFHFNPRMNENAVVRNSQQMSKWGAEERAANFFPFIPGVVFHLLVRCHSTHYEVVVNGQHFITFNHRIHPITAVSSIFINGNVVMHTVNITM